MPQLYGTDEMTVIPPPSYEALFLTNENTQTIVAHTMTNFWPLRKLLRKRRKECGHRNPPP